ncbi:class I SAM-dependent methyltransferase [Actinocrispum wychmicini]|uniref:Ubiquinone/menaquinone biosynthesis C-methylase UbiE n=1 Tax=Actinocrispum wychmicini TaxID=1213861 RepID=A0A4R2JRF2_9PSEU|nr:class I SAM-dependent methyltransferase [Actinocrispum wychmicini]TCO59796.1 ubiquinone/menaquinone biosynthesis C-methylase UbiE [Actinocrispum wychmicini]
MPDPKNSLHAVVLGGGIAGMCVAAALARHMAKVTVIERDLYPDGPHWRRGVPQARHTHNLLGAGQRALDRLFPGLLADFREQGIVDVRMPKDMLAMIPGGWMERFASKHVVLSGTRDLIDWRVRNHLIKVPNVEIRQECEALSLLSEGDTVVGVKLRDRDSSAKTGWGEPYNFAADFVVDTTGRNSKSASWLEELGYGTVEESVVDAQCAYATCIFAIPPDHEADWKCIVLQSTPDVPRQGILNPIEGDRWMVSVSGVGGERPPLDHKGMIEFAKSLRSSEIYDHIRNAEPLTEVYGSGRTENRRRHYERFGRWPDRFVVTGDAVGCFNPAYGQGISVASTCAVDMDDAFEAAGTRDTGRIPAGLAADLRKPIARRVDGAWMLSANSDLVYPGAAPGPLPLPARLVGRYMGRLVQTAVTKGPAAMALLDTYHLLAPPEAVFRPSVVLDVLRGPKSKETAVSGNGETTRLVNLYRKRAKNYDIMSNRLYIIGQRTMHYKHLAIDQLALKPGDTVVDAGCGTGHNLPYLSKAVGPNGKVIGVDFTDSMLNLAEDRVREHELTNVTLQQADLTTFEFPQNVNAIIACFALTLIEGYETVVKNGYKALASGGRWVALDYRLPDWWPRGLVPALGPVIAPFGGKPDMLVNRHPWKAIEQGADKTHTLTRYGGWVYVTTGIAP